MAFLILFAMAAATSFGLHWLKGLWPLSVFIPTVGFVGCILFDAYVLPYRGGGASMWPIAVLLGSPVVLIGGLCGAAAADFPKPS
jgi:hypothetical protein